MRSSTSRCFYTCQQCSFLTARTCMRHSTSTRTKRSRTVPLCTLTSPWQSTSTQQRWWLSISSAPISRMASSWASRRWWFMHSPASCSSSYSLAFSLQSMLWSNYGIVFGSPTRKTWSYSITCTRVYSFSASRKKAATIGLSCSATSRFRSCCPIAQMYIHLAVLLPGIPCILRFPRLIRAKTLALGQLKMQQSFTASRQ